MPLQALFQLQPGTYVEPLTFYELAGKLLHIRMKGKVLDEKYVHVQKIITIWFTAYEVSLKTNKNITRLPLYFALQNSLSKFTNLRKTLRFIIYRMLVNSETKFIQGNQLVGLIVFIVCGKMHCEHESQSMYNKYVKLFILDARQLLAKIA